MFFHKPLTSWVLKNSEVSKVALIAFNLWMYFGCKKWTKIITSSNVLQFHFVNSFNMKSQLLTIAWGKPSVNFSKAAMICSLVLVVLKSLLEVPSALRIPSILNPSVAVDEMVSLQTIYLGLVTALSLCSSSVGAHWSIWHIFSYMSYNKKMSEVPKNFSCKSQRYKNVTIELKDEIMEALRVSFWSILFVNNG